MKRIQLTAPASIRTTIQLPSSKSICNRALIINALAYGTCVPENLSDCDDTRVMIRALQDMPETIDILAAGTAMRFLTAYLSVTEGTHILTGTTRMKQRPIQLLVDALRSLGARIDYVENEGFPPLRITGSKLTGNEITLPGSVSSQYISALLMIGPVLENGLTIHLTGDIISRSYIDLTLQLMHEFGAEAGWKAENTLTVSARPYRPIPYYVENDWSAASYWYEIAALAEEAEIELPGLFRQSYQGDSKVAELFGQLGVKTIYEDRKVILRKNGTPVTRMDYNFINQLLDIPFRFTGLQSLKIKETDRIAALIAEMKKLGYVIREAEDSILYWEGERCEADADPAIDTYEDHRMAMAFAPAILRQEKLAINHPEVVSKSYPRYWDNLLTAGFGITEV